MNRLVTLFAVLSCVFVPGRAADQAVELRLGYFPNLTHAQALYARAGGQFAEKVGVPIRWTSFNSGPAPIEALFTGAIDAAFVGPNPAITGHIRSRGEVFAIIAGGASGGTGLVVRRDSGIGTARDFNDKVIATPQLGNTQDVAARQWFGEQGYRFREKGGSLTVIALPNQDQLSMMQKHQIDGAWTVEPWLSRLEIEAGARLFLDEKTLWPEGRYVTTHLIVRKRFAAANPEVISRLLAALVEVTQAINADKVAAARILNAQLKAETGKPLREAVIRQAMERVEFTWDPLSASLRRSAAAAHQVGFLRQPPDLAGIYQLGPLNAVLAAKGLPPVGE